MAPRRRLAAAVATAALGIIACARGQDPLEAEIRRAAAERRASSGPVPVDLAVGDDEWDRMVVVGPYSTPAMASEAAGTDVPARRLHRIDSRDDINVVLRLRENRLVATTAVRRSVADLLPLTEGEPLEPTALVVADLRTPAPAEDAEVILRRA